MRSAARLLIALATLALALGAAACSRSQDTAATPTLTGSASVVSPTASPAPTPVVLGEVNETDPDSVAVTLSVHDTRTDTSSQAVWARALPWLTGDLATSAQAGGASEVERPDNRWAMMQSHQAHDVVENIDRHTDDPIPDTATGAQRQRAVSVRAYGDNGWSGLVRTARYWLTMTNVDGAWRVSVVRSVID